LPYLADSFLADSVRFHLSLSLSLSLSLAALSKRAIAVLQGKAHLSGFPNLLGYHPPPTYLPLLFDPRPARARKLAWRLDGTSRERAVSLTASANRDDAPHPLLCFRFRNFHIREGTRAARLNVACPGEKPLALARARQEIGV